MNNDFPDNWDEIKNRKQLLLNKKKAVRFPDSAFYFLSKVGGASAVHVHVQVSFPDHRLQRFGLGMSLQANGGGTRY